MRITQQAKEESRARILEKAAELFAAKGFEGTSTREIAQAAEVAAGTLFNYFPSKETLGMTLVTETLGRGREDYQRRRTGEEGLAEELFLFIASGLRRLRPLRPFLAPVLERSLSPFPRKSVCQEGEMARLEHLAAVREILSRQGFVAAPDEVALTLYWSLYLGILACWTGDESPHQEGTQSLIDYSIRMFVQAISGPSDESGASHAG